MVPVLLAPAALQAVLPMAVALDAAAAFAVTVAIGEAACVWLAYRHRGLTAPTAEVRSAFANGLATGLRQAKTRTTKPEQRI